MKFDPYIHHRHSIRLKKYDYSQNGFYFITICTNNRECFFEKHPVLKNIVRNQWENIPKHFPCVELDEYIIMPNHIHGIIVVGATFTVAQYQRLSRNHFGAGARPAPTIGDIVGSFKSLCINEWLKYIKQNTINELGKFWQRNYYEHIIRNDHELNRIRKYIINNPLKWELDNNNPNNKSHKPPKLICS